MYVFDLLFHYALPHIDIFTSGESFPLPGVRGGARGGVRCERRNDRRSSGGGAGGRRAGVEMLF